jgi:RNase H-fold protein (predicted Holliday junction resolvase)
MVGSAAQENSEGCEKVEAKEFLKQPERLDLRIKNKLIEKQQWKEIALGITANMDGERVQSTGAKSKMAEAVIKCVDMEAEIDSLVDELIDTKKEVIQTIERLDSPTEYNVLHMRYIQYKSLQEIADHYHRDYGWATTTHGRALKSVQELLGK